MESPVATVRPLVSIALIAAFVAFCILGVWWFTNRTWFANDRTWGSGTAYRIYFDNGTSLRFLDGVFSTDALSVSFPRTELKTRRAEETLTASSDPNDYRVFISEEVVIDDATDPLHIPGTNTVLVRRSRDIASCTLEGTCTSLYTFGTALSGPASFSATKDTFALFNPLAREVQLFTFSDDFSLVPLTTFSLEETQTRIALDPTVPGRVLFTRVARGEDRSVEVPFPDGSEGTYVVKLPTTLLSICAFDTKEKETPPLCVSQLRDGPPYTVTLFAYE